MDRREGVINNVVGFFLEGEEGYEEDMWEIREAVEDSSEDEDEDDEDESEDIEMGDDNGEAEDSDKDEGEDEERENSSITNGDGMDGVERAMNVVTLADKTTNGGWSWLESCGADFGSF
jgi:hypothetical protein